MFLVVYRYSQIVVADGCITASGVPAFGGPLPGDVTVVYTSLRVTARFAPGTRDFKSSARVVVDSPLSSVGICAKQRDNPSLKFRLLWVKRIDKRKE